MLPQAPATSLDVTPFSCAGAGTTTAGRRSHCISRDGRSRCVGRGRCIDGGTAAGEGRNLRLGHVREHLNAHRNK